jgi:hypothetical protein
MADGPSFSSSTSAAFLDSVEVGARVIRVLLRSDPGAAAGDRALDGDLLGDLPFRVEVLEGPEGFLFRREPIHLHFGDLGPIVVKLFPCHASSSVLLIVRSGPAAGHDVPVTVQPTGVLFARLVERTESTLRFPHLLVVVENLAESRYRIIGVKLVDVHEQSIIVSSRRIEVAVALALGHPRRLKQIVRVGVEPPIVVLRLLRRIGTAEYEQNDFRHAVG